uniref:Rad50/SbcC-type AAA domain-containing protein n=1 Tax=Meloidogyne javanica TaxID=6303 RepID=A0A915MFG6_MELJA
MSSAVSKKRGFDDSFQSDDSRLAKRSLLMPEVAGKITCIELVNFMCHSSLTLNFDVSKYNCSYIIGPNGSGKSALFAALNIGLGGAGRSNERGKRINDYIKENENYSLIRIHLSNEGPNSIPDYGDIIIVERRITHKISTVTIKTRLNEGKEEIVGKRRELDLILQQFNIDLENPLSWLSQDRARQFLQSMKPQRLYELYKKSSEMDGAEDLFRNIDTLFDELTRVVKSMDKEKTAKEAKYQQMKARFDAVNQLSNKKEAIQRLYWYQLWAPKGIGDINKQQKNFEEQLGVASSKFREHNEKLNELKRKARELNFDHHDLVDKVKRKQWNIDLYERQLQKANRELRDLVGSSAHDPETEKNQLKEKLTQIAAQMEAVELEQKSYTNELSSIKVEYENLKKEFKENTDQYSLLERRRTRIIEEKTLFEQSKADKLAIFGKDVPRLLELIDTNINSFKKRPIGPIGNYIKLKDKKWANPIEFCLKNMIGTFLCDSSEDRKALDEICKTLQIRKPNVITT